MTAVSTTGTSTAVFDVWLADDYWADTSLTFSFPVDASTYVYRAFESVSTLSDSQKAAVRTALEEISSFTGLNFTEITESGATKGDLRFGSDVSLNGANAFLPEIHERGGDAFFGLKTQDPLVGNEGYLYFTHEIGHAMGLNHGHEYQSFRDSGMDSQEFTVMTYTDYIGDTDSTYDSGLIDWAQTYMQLDIAAMQFLYGANYAASGELWSGDTTYAFSPTTGEMSINGVGQGVPAGNRIFRTIWDGDGSDTYDLSNYTTDLDVDLRPGEWLVLDDAQLADLNKNDSSASFNARGNVANALLVNDDARALIEKVIGGSGNDRIFGNDADNNLKGNDGDDRLFGRSGADKIKGHSGEDIIFGNNGADLLKGGRGQDELFGGGGGDTLKGGGNSDQLFGGNGKDALFGQAGKDFLTGGKGRDTMTGGAGNDTFVFTNLTDSGLDSEADIITDFTSGSDRIDLSALSEDGFNFEAEGEFGGSGSWVITSFDGSDTIVLVDIDGDANADFSLILQGTAFVVESDFIL